MFNRPTPPPSFEALLASFKDHWRAQDTVFELVTARDFVRLNGSELLLAPNEDGGQFSFYVRVAGAPLRVPAGGGVSAMENDATPILGEFAKPLATPDATPILKDFEPPALSALRPLPHYARPAGPMVSAAEGDQTPIEPREESVQPAVSPTADTMVNMPTPLVPVTVPPPPPESQSVIVPAKIPPPQLPSQLRTPPASTSNVALTRDTQTMNPAAPESKSVQDDAPGDTPPESGPPRDAPSREEAS
jgi:hypothetical protein